MKLINTFLCFFLLATGIMTAQEGMKEGYIKMEITDVITENQEMAAMLEMMKGTETEVYFQDGKSLTNMNLMGGMVQMKNMLDKDGNMNMFMDAMGNKMHVETTKMEMDKMKAENPNPMDDLDITYDENDRKKIAGYDCYKMIAKGKGDASSFNIEAYVTEDIKINASVMQGIDLGIFKGFPLEYIIDAGQMKLVSTTMEIKDEVDSKVFVIDDSGYTKMSMEEFMGSMGQMGGFGF